MKIGIMSYHWAPNFGANLQALSISSLLSKMGHDVVFLNYRYKPLEDWYFKNVSSEQIDAHEHFCDTYFVQSPIFRSEREIVEFCGDKKFDVIMVGSDAIFRLSKQSTTIDDTFPNPYWMDWAQSGLTPKPRTGFLAGSAMGSRYYSFSWNMQRGIQDVLRRVDYISVRDRWTQWMFFWVTFGRYWPKICPDPVSFINEVFVLPDSYTAEPTSLHKKYILLSVYSGQFSDDWVREFVDIAHNRGFQVFGLPQPESKMILPLDRIIDLPLSPLAWYAWIQHSAGYIGVRFHPIVCSVFNDVPFVSIDTYSRKYFRFIKMRMASKTYDFCMNVRARSRCICSSKAYQLSPRKALEILQDWDKGEIRDYVVKAKRDFTKTVDELLGLKNL